MSRNLESGVYDSSQSKTIGSRPFQRLDEGSSGVSLDRDATKYRDKSVVTDIGEGESTDGDEVPLKGIRVKTEMQWNEEGKNIVPKNNPERMY